MNQNKLGALALIAVACVWGTMIPVITHLSKNWDPYFMAMTRYVGGVPLLFCALWLSEGFARPTVRHALWRSVVPGWLGLCGFAFLFTIGVAHANPAIAAVLSAANPVIAAIVGGVMFRIPFDRRLMPAVILAVVGCALATVNWSAGGVSFGLRGGEVLILIAQSLWAWYSLAIHRWLNGWSQLRKAANTMAHGAVAILLVYWLAFHFGWADAAPAVPGATDFGIFVWMTVGAIVLGLLLWNYGVAKTDLVTASLYSNLAPIIAISLLALSGEPPRASQLIGGALVIGGVVWSEWRLLQARRGGGHG